VFFRINELKTVMIILNFADGKVKGFERFNECLKGARNAEGCNVRQEFRWRDL
jgi:hypothetical protein